MPRQGETTTIKNMKVNLYEWCSRTLDITYNEAKRFIKLLKKSEFAFNAFMQDYWNYYAEIGS